VSLAGLDLHSERGAKLALSRIRQAAKDVCGVPVDMGPVWASARPNTCVIAVVNRAVVTLDNPVVTALNAGGGRSSAQLANRGR
jgi:UrcA family protein